MKPSRTVGNVRVVPVLFFPITPNTKNTITLGELGSIGCVVETA